MTTPHSKDFLSIEENFKNLKNFENSGVL